MIAAKKIISLLLCVTLIGFLGSCSGKDVKPPLDSGLTPVSFKPPRPVSWILGNGLRVMYLQDPELPLVRGTLYLRGGTLWEQPRQQGTVSVMGTLLRNGGAGSLTADALDLELEKLSAGISSGMSSEFGTVGFTCLKNDLPRVFDLFTDVLLLPRFEQGRLEILKGQAIEGIRRRKDDGHMMAAVSMNELLFRGSPYGRNLKTADIKALSRRKINDAYKEFITPREGIFTITGPLERTEIEALLNKRLARWDPVTKGRRVPPPAPDEPPPGVYYIPGPFTQATILVGQQGPPRRSPDQYGIQGFNEVFGEDGLSSRLSDRLRTELGLVYYAGGGIFPGVVKGKNSIIAQTKGASAGQALVEAIKTLGVMQTALVPQNELEEKKLGIINSFVFANETTDATLSRQANFQLFGYPPDYDEHYIENIKKVSPELVLSVAQRRWDVNNLVVVVVGNDTALASLESALGDIPKALRESGIIKASFDEGIVIPGKT